MDQIARLLAGKGGLLRARGGANGLGVLGGGVRAAAAYLQHRRNLNLHEYQSMHLMKEFNIKTPMFSPAYSPEEALAATAQLQQQHPGHSVIVKAQVLAGGRGLGHFKENGFQGGVHSCKTPEEAADVARKMLGNTLVTKQTGAEGKPCSVVLVCEQFPIKKEMYLAMLLDRGSGGPMLIGSARGGTSIEDIAHGHPESIIKMPIDLLKGIEEEALNRFLDGMHLSSSSQREELASVVRNLHSLFKEKDCLLVEINPLVETQDGALRVVDAKLNFDDNAQFRQKEVFEQRDISQENPGELEAEKHHLNYIKLDGEIGCMVNGAGLAMATMDLIKLKGGAPANFLDVGGSADEEQIVQALNIIQQDQDAKSVLVNIFGGIMRCDIIAQGLLRAIKQVGFTKPIVIRLEGTNKTQAEELLRAAFKDAEAANLRIEAINDFDQAAERVVQLTTSL